MPDPESNPARLTPYELVFGAELFETSIFPDIRQELEARDMEAPPPDRFLFLTTVGKLLRVIAGAEPSEGEAGQRSTDADEDMDAGPGAAGEALTEHGALLFQAFRFWRNGRQLFVVDEGAVRAMLADDAGPSDEVLNPPHGSGYLQLPRHLIWARAAEGQPPEALDGVFWSLLETGDGATRLDVLLVLGMRADRPGFSVVPVSAELAAGRPGDWAGSARPEGDDFDNVLPGGELDGLFAVATRAEALKLVALWFRYLERHPEALGGVEENLEDAEPASAHDLPASRLAFRRVGV